MNRIAVCRKALTGNVAKYASRPHALDCQLQEEVESGTDGSVARWETTLGRRNPAIVRQAGALERSKIRLFVLDRACPIPAGLRLSLSVDRCVVLYVWCSNVFHDHPVDSDVPESLALQCRESWGSPKESDTRWLFLGINSWNL